LMEEIFFSFTFGGEALSLAASLATLTKLQKEPVIKTMQARGQTLLDKVQALIHKLNVSDFIELSGHPVWSFLIFKSTKTYTDWQIKTLFLQEIFSKGILTIGTHNLSYSHSAEDISKLLEVYEEIFLTLKSAIEDLKLDTLLRCQPLVPLFKVR